MPKDKFYPPDLDVAIESGDLEEIQRIIDLINCIDMGEKYLSSSRYLMTAVETGKAEIVQLLVDAGANVNQRDDDGWTALMYATLEGYFDIIKIMIDAGADVNIQSFSGEYALYIAAYRGNQEIFDYLLAITDFKLIQEAESILPEKISERQKTETVQLGVRGLIKAAEEGRLHQVRQAIEGGIDINGVDEMDYTALKSAVMRGHWEVVCVLLQNGADPNFGNLQSPLMNAVVSQNLKIIKLLIEFGANINIMVQGNTALHYAVQFSTPEVVRYLIEAGANINAKTTEGWNALSAAVNAGSIEIVKLLLSAGADVNVKDIWGDTALSRALKAGHQEIVQFLKNAGAKED